MFITAPVPHLCIALSIHMDKDSQAELLSIIQTVSTTDVDTGSAKMNEAFQAFTKRLKTEKNLVFYTASFVAYYFQITNKERLYEIFETLYLSFKEYNYDIREKDSGFLSGIFLTALLSDSKLKSNDKIYIPENIKKAIEYIESEDYIVHLEKK